MKKKIFALLAMVALMAQPAFAMGHGDCDKCPMKHKLLRGVEGIVTSPIEYVNQYNVLAETRRPASGMIGTVLAGTAMTAKRLINGVYDVVTFPVDLPKDGRLLLNDKHETALASYKKGSCAK
ncbi:MAG TPA: hypothetical protein PLY88_07025 [Candidatus Omnitrophota bacterium]|nr:hypothetical protein [Candidatus Omnitrophota bacterium]HRK62279.1 hypothetical protein [Candidatus Omnitrophota bacterium]